MYIYLNSFLTSTRRGVSGHLYTSATLLPGKEPTVSINRMSGSQCHPGCCRVENLLATPGMGPRFFSCPARSVVPALTGLSRLPIFYSSDLKFWHEKYITLLFRTIFGKLYVIKQSAIIVPGRILRLYNKVDCAFRPHVPQISGAGLICRRH